MNEREQAQIYYNEKLTERQKLKYEWQDAGTGRSIKFHEKGKYVSGENTATISVENGGRYKDGWGPTLRCKISDSTGEKFSENCEISRRHVRARS